MCFCESYFLDGDELADVLSCGEFSKGAGEWVVWWECRIEFSDGFKDEESEVSLCEDVVDSVWSEEEGDTNSINEVAECFVHVVDEGDRNTKMGGDGW